MKIVCCYIDFIGRVAENIKIKCVKAVFRVCGLALSYGYTDTRLFHSSVVVVVEAGA